MSQVICVLALSPFVILIVVGSFKVDPSRWFELPKTGNSTSIDVVDDDVDTEGGIISNISWGGVFWRPFLNNLFWNLNSFDSGGNMVAELDSTTPFIRPMMVGFLLTVSFYLFPLLIATGASDAEQEDWTDGYLAVINSEVVGPWLGAWTIFAAGISNIALFQAELTSDAYQLMGMADRGYLPKIFSKRSRHGTPTYGLILGTAVIVLMGVSDLDRLIEMLNFNYSVALLIEYAAFFKLRISRPNIERPYRIPLNTLGCAVFFFPTVSATLLVICLADFTTYYFAVGTWLVGYLLYAVKRQNDQISFSTALEEGNRGDGYAHVAVESVEGDEMDLGVDENTTNGEFS